MMMPPLKMYIPVFLVAAVGDNIGDDDDDDDDDGGGGSDDDDDDDDDDDASPQNVFSCLLSCCSW